MFFTTVKDPSLVSNFFDMIRTNLGRGIKADHKFSDFSNPDNIISLPMARAFTLNGPYT